MSHHCPVLRLTGRVVCPLRESQAGEPQSATLRKAFTHGRAFTGRRSGRGAGGAWGALGWRVNRPPKGVAGDGVCSQILTVVPAWMSNFSRRQSSCGG
jgi:hypothetical protein